MTKQVLWVVEHKDKREKTWDPSCFMVFYRKRDADRASGKMARDIVGYKPKEYRVVKYTPE